MAQEAEERRCYRSGLIISTQWRGLLYGLVGPFRRSSSGSLAKFAASRRASSLVSSLAAERRPGSSSK